MSDVTSERITELLEDMSWAYEPHSSAMSDALDALKLVVPLRECVDLLRDGLAPVDIDGDRWAWVDQTGRLRPPQPMTPEHQAVMKRG